MAESITAHVREAEEEGEDEDLDPGDEKEEEAPARDAMPEATAAFIKTALQKVPCFMNLDDATKFRLVTSRMTKLTVEVGTVLMHKGDKGSTIFVIESGAMECVVDGVKVAEVGPGRVIGERAMLTNCARTATVAALRETVVWCLDRKNAPRFLVREADSVGRRVLALESLSMSTRVDASFLMPSSMAGIITNKLDTLSPYATTLVKLASSFGPVFHKDALRECFTGHRRSWDRGRLRR